jgi:OmpA-OmpF porin, OOP family
MRIFKTLRLCSLMGLSPFIASAVFAQDNYFYGGVGAGQSRGSLNAESTTASQGGPGLVINSISTKTKDNAYKVFLGYQVNRNFGAEVSYFHLGQFEFDAATSAGGLNGKLRLQGGGIDAVGTLPFTDNLSGLVRGGVQMARSRSTFEGNGGFVPNNPAPSKREVNGKLGLGLQYAFTPNVMMRAEVERYRINDAVGHHPNVNLYSVSLVMPFGRSMQPMRSAQMMSATPQ